MLQLLNKKSTIGLFASTAIILLFSVCFLKVTNAATLSITPVTSKVSSGNIISTKVIVSTSGKTINNSDGIIQFPVDLLEVVSINKSSSIFSLWVEDPKFSNQEGKITFNGGIPNPGFAGENGEIASIVFRAKKQGIASIVFGDSAVRENDGFGTNILTSKQSATIDIGSVVQVPVPNNQLEKKGVPVKPTIVSSTHPQQDVWYSSSNASFSWVVPEGTVSIQTLLGRISNSTPTINYDSSVSQKTISNLAEGVSYFHLRYVNESGAGPIAHYKVQVDRVPPENFSIDVKNEEFRDIVYISALDASSGVDSFSFKIDNKPAFRVSKDLLGKNSEYLLPIENSGEHNLSAIVYDKAGNHSETNTTYTSSEIIGPKIKLESESIFKNNTAQVIGTSNYPQSNIDIYIENEDGNTKTYRTISDTNGSFLFSIPEFKSTGNYNVWSQISFENDIKSPVSNKILLRVVDTNFVKNTKDITLALSMVILISIMVLFILLLAYIGWHSFFGLKKRMKKDLDITIHDVHKVMMAFKDELSRQLSILEGAKEDRSLNKKEEKIFRELRDNIDTIDSFVEKKIKKIK